jgi:hypothetical protein
MEKKMLMLTPEYAALRERRARETIDWLVGNFDLKPLPKPVYARLKIGRRSEQQAKKKAKK